MEEQNEEQDQLVPEEEGQLIDDEGAAQIASEREADATKKRQERLAALGAELASRRDEWVSARIANGFDSRVTEDLDQFNGRDRATRGARSELVNVVEGSARPGPSEGTAQRSTVFVQVTRQKTNAGAARLGDTVLPSDERNFSIGPTAVPTMPSWMTQPANPGQPEQPTGTPQGMQPTQGTMGGQAAQMDPVAQAAKQAADKYAEAKRAANAMETAIEDCMNECDYPAEVRRVIFDAALMGTGVLKGPVVVKRTRKAWQSVRDLKGQNIWTLQVVEDLSPASFRIDPTTVYPDPACGDNVQNGRGIFELSRKTSKQVRELKDQPGYEAAQIDLVVEEGPLQVSSVNRFYSEEDRTDAAGELYEHWIYWGELESEALEAAGVDVPPGGVVSACVEFINSTVVRAYLNPLADGALPYDFFSWEQVPGSVWGYGIPYLMRAQQRVINSAWRMILDNAGVSSGPQIVVKPGLVRPADKKWDIHARKIWYATDDVDDVRKAFTTFEFNSHQVELQAIIEMAEKLSDAETAVPMLAQGERGAAPETVGGMQMLMNSANVVLKRLVKQFDDCITKPHVRRYYNYLMEYGTDPAIKGDFQVVALGSSSLVVRDIQNQSLSNLLGLATNPAYAPLINLKKLFSKVLKAEHIDPSDVMNSDDEIARAQEAAAKNQGPDPRVAAAQFRADADRMRTQAQVQMNQQTLATKHEIAGQDRAMRLRELEMQRDIEMLRVSQKTNLTVAQIKAQLAAVALRERANTDRAAADRTIKHAEASAPKKPSAPAIA